MALAAILQAFHCYPVTRCAWLRDRFQPVVRVDSSGVSSL